MDIQSLIEPPYPQHDFSTALSPTQPLPPSEDGLIPCNFDKKPGSSEEAKRRKVNSDASRRFRERERLKKLLNEKEREICSLTKQRDHYQSQRDYYYHTLCLYMHPDQLAGRPPTPL